MKGTTKMPRCGNCKENHASVEEVIACYHRAGTQLVLPEVQVQAQPKRTPVPQHLTQRGGGTSTPRQRQFVEDLLTQCDMSAEEYFGKSVTDMSFEEASAGIDRLKEERRKLHPPKTLGANVLGDEVPQGTYTVVFATRDDSWRKVPDDDGAERITLRFRAPRTGHWTDTQLVEYMFGPDNEADFRRIGNRTKDGYRIWKDYREDGRIMRGVRFMVAPDTTEQDRAEAGYTYSLASSRCYRCSRKLTVPASIHRGLGPECAGILGVA
jgi:hypothetical protein